MSHKTSHVVIAEDEVFVQRLLAAYLEKEGFRVSVAGSGRELLRILDSDPSDLLILDLGLPDEDGLALVRQIRMHSRMPIIILTAREERDSRLAALELGADDYLIKPCDPEELALRIQNMLRRGSGSPGDDSGPETQQYRFRGWTLDLGARSLQNPQNEDCHLSRAEFNLLAALCSAPNRVLSRGQLLDAIRVDDSDPSERMIDVFIARLRSKIESNPKQPEMIKTVVGMGYKFSARIS